jgi:hypothetical protein
VASRAGSPNRQQPGPLGPLVAASGRTHREVAALSGIPRRSVCDYLRGLHLPRRPEIYAALDRALGAPVGTCEEILLS